MSVVPGHFCGTMPITPQRPVIRRRPPLQAVPEPISGLVKSDGWKKLDRPRGAHCHPRRPQSAGVDGVPLASPWVASGGVMSLNFGGREYTDGDGLAHDTSDLARRVLALLAGTM